MYSSHFKIKKSKDDPTEVNLEMATDKDLIHPDCGVSFNADYVFHCQKNYEGVHRTLSELIAEGILSYDDAKSNAKEHIFKHELIQGAKTFTLERVTKNTSQNDVRTLEQMLYSVCRNHNKPIDAAISPYTLLTRMYDRWKHPSLQQQLEHANIFLTTSCVLVTIALGATIAEKVLTFNRPQPQ